MKKTVLDYLKNTTHGLKKVCICSGVTWLLFFNHSAALVKRTIYHLPQRYRLLILLLILKTNTGWCEAEGYRKNDSIKPNVIVIMADQWRAQAFGFRGDPNVRTPHIDSLASQSVTFLNAVSGLPVCTPARASFMSGQRPLKNGVFMNDIQLDTNTITIAKVFRNAGYKTGAIGKWHIDGNGRSAFIPPGNRRQGFDYWKVMECTHDYNHSLYYENTPDTLMWKGYDAFAQTSDACNYIAARAGDQQPFFLFLSWGPPHELYQTAPEEFRNLYAPEKIQLRENVPVAHQAMARKDLAGYYAHCTALDTQVGKIMEVLKQTALDKNTIVLFLSDHGDMLGSHGAYKKEQPYDESTLVPMIFKIPSSIGAHAGFKEEPIAMEDVMPTLLGLCCLRIPGTVDGLDYSGFMKGKSDQVDTVKLLSCIQPFGQWSRKRGGKEYRGIRTTQFTYVRDLKGPWLLFDNKNDPYQEHNLVHKNNRLVKYFDGLLDARLKAEGDKFLKGMEYVKKYNYPPLGENETIRYKK